MKIIIASKNPVKMNAAKEGFAKMFPDDSFEFEGIDVPSGVSDQPMGDDETYKGAKHRAMNALKAASDSDYCVGIEGGLEESEDGLESFAWIFVLRRDGKHGQARSASFLLPQSVSQLVLGGMEYGEAGDKVFKETNLKQKGGLISLLTNDAVTRTDFYIQPMMLALIPFRNPDHY